MFSRIGLVRLSDMHVEFWGAAQVVTGSKHLIHFQGKRLLLDCGIFQGRRKDAFRENRELPFDAQSVDAVILSQCAYRSQWKPSVTCAWWIQGPDLCQHRQREIWPFTCCSTRPKSKNRMCATSIRSVLKMARHFLSHSMSKKTPFERFSRCGVKIFIPPLSRCPACNVAFILQGTC